MTQVVETQKSEEFAGKDIKGQPQACKQDLPLPFNLSDNAGFVRIVGGGIQPLGKDAGFLDSAEGVGKKAAVPPVQSELPAKDPTVATHAFNKLS